MEIIRRQWINYAKDTNGFVANGCRSSIRREFARVRNRIWLHFTWRKLELQRTWASLKMRAVLFETCSFRRFRRRPRRKDVTRIRRLFHPSWTHLSPSLSPVYLSFSLQPSVRVSVFLLRSTVHRSIRAALSSFKSHNRERGRIRLKLSFEVSARLGIFGKKTYWKYLARKRITVDDVDRYYYFYGAYICE